MFLNDAFFTNSIRGHNFFYIKSMQLSRSTFQIIDNHHDIVYILSPMRSICAPKGFEGGLRRSRTNFNTVEFRAVLRPAGQSEWQDVGCVGHENTSLAVRIDRAERAIRSALSLRGAR